MPTPITPTSALPVAITGRAASRCDHDRPLHVAIVGDRSPWTLWLGRIVQEAGLQVTHMRLREDTAPADEAPRTSAGQGPALVVLSLFEADSPLRSILPATNRLDATTWSRRVTRVLRHAGGAPVLLLGDPDGHGDKLTAGLTLGAADVLTPADLGTPHVVMTRLLRLGRKIELIARQAPWRDSTGRVHAGQLAAALGVSLRRLSRATPVTHQALSANPTSPRAQATLEAIALVLDRETDTLSATERAQWARKPHHGLDDLAPRDALAAPHARSAAPRSSTASAR